MTTVQGCISSVSATRIAARLSASTLPRRIGNALVMRRRGGQCRALADQLMIEGTKEPSGRREHGAFAAHHQRLSQYHRVLSARALLGRRLRWPSRIARKRSPANSSRTPSLRPDRKGDAPERPRIRPLDARREGTPRTRTPTIFGGCSTTSRSTRRCSWGSASPNPGLGARSPKGRLSMQDRLPTPGAAPLLMRKRHRRTIRCRASGSGRTAFEAGGESIPDSASDNVIENQQQGSGKTGNR